MGVIVGVIVGVGAGVGVGVGVGACVHSDVRCKDQRSYDGLTCVSKSSLVMSTSPTWVMYEPAAMPRSTR